MERASGVPDRRDDESEDRRTRERRAATNDVPLERRSSERRRIARRLIDVFRTFVTSRGEGRR